MEQEVMERRKCLCECKICGWLWFKRSPAEKPEKCPHCKNTGWQTGRRRAANKPKDQQDSEV